MTLIAETAAPGIGHNNPPLDEVLADEIKADAARMTELVTAANNAQIANGEQQKQVATLAGLIGSHWTDVEAKRKARKQEFDQGALAVQRAYKPVLDPLAAARDRLRALNDNYEAEQDRLREAERRRLAAAEEAKRREAEEAQAKADAAKAQGKSGLAAELAAIQAQDEADAAAREREQVRAAPVRTDVGSASRSTVTSYAIEDLTACLGYLRKTQRAALLEHIQPLVNRLGRAKVLMPGVKVVEQKHTRFGR